VCKSRTGASNLKVAKQETNFIFINVVSCYIINNGFSYMYNRFANHIC
jgi:hypothetical protein